MAQYSITTEHHEGRAVWHRVRASLLLMLSWKWQGLITIKLANRAPLCQIYDSIFRMSTPLSLKMS